MKDKNKYAIGVDLGGTAIKFGLVDQSGKIVKKLSLDSRANEGPEKVIEQIKNGIELFIKENSNIEGIGIGAPGSVVVKKGTVENPPNLPGWKSIHLGEIIQKKFNKKVFVENDANAAAICEMIFGTGRKLNNFIMITLGTGVGGGIIINRKIFRGEAGIAGELGHISINENGPKCNCGSNGCIEAYIGINYLIKKVKRDLHRKPKSLLNKLINKEKKKLTPKLIYDASKKGDKFALSVIEYVGNKLGVALASVVNIFDIPNIIIGGGVAGFGDVLFKSTRETLIERVLKSSKKRIKIKKAQLKNDAGIKGASALVFYKS
jgi:glucokinase